ncbi:phosphatase PAP2 family protein [Saccharomonospora saliphila]|uniref:phosphatase PAP2 family protein n=1 Tax=Saccharomonospora saliphila TaxID=369829 RepID=UPI000365E296|nr:phosphatase PAP2 family protein [Saccharomonospora saliphila]
MTVRTEARPDGHTRWARGLTEVFAPWVIVIVLSVAVAWAATRAWLPTMAWGLLIALTSSVLPMGVIVWGARTGRWDGHHVRDRGGRLVPFVALIVLSGLGLTLLVLWGAPWTLIALDVSMLASLLVTGAITAWWKVSMHAAVAAGAVAILAATYTPWAWTALVLVAAVCWSRVRLRDHTPAQVAVGSVAGVVVGGGAFVLVL